MLHGAKSVLLGGNIRDTLLTGTSSDPELAVSRQPIFTDGRSLSRQRRSRMYDSQQVVVRGEVSGEFSTGGLFHRILIGADHDEFDNLQDFRRVRPPSVGSNPSDEAAYVIDIFDPVRMSRQMVFEAAYAMTTAYRSFEQQRSGFSAGAEDSEG